MIRRLLPLLALLALLPAPASAGQRPRYGGSVAAALPQRDPVLEPAQAATAAELFLASLVHQAPLARGPDGALRPVLLTEVPRPEEGGRRFRLELREGLRFHDGRKITAADLEASLRRLAGGPWAALVLPIAELQVRSETLLEVRLAFPLPHWPEALAEPAAAVVPARTADAAPPGAGPFRIAARDVSSLRLEAFAGHVAGRPFLDAVAVLLQPDRRAAARLVAGGRDAVGPGGGSATPRASWILVHPSLPLDGTVARAIDRADLVRWFVPGAATPLDRLLPAPHAAPAPAAVEARAASGPLALLYDPAVEGHRQVAERIQLRLHDRGVQVRLEPLDAAALRRRTSAGGYQLALIERPLPAGSAFAAASLLHAAGRQQEALRLLESGGEGFGQVRGIVPLYAAPQGLVPAAGARLQGGGGLEGRWLPPGQETP